MLGYQINEVFHCVKGLYNMTNYLERDSGIILFHADNYADLIENFLWGTNVYK